jgi:putative spermidine/putrescine transport system ATP-binding protein
MAEIIFQGVTKKYDDTTALNNFDLTIGSGELISLLGPSGCGKTTALRAVAGFIEINEGDILLDGKSIKDTPPAKRGFGMVFQAYSLFPNMSAEQNINFALELKKVKPEVRKKRVNELLEVVNLQEHKKKFPHQLSGGQQQRVALARALATEPPVLLLDEPLSALDANVRDQLRDEIRDVQKKLGITTIFVTHDQNEAMYISDRVAVMRSGSLQQIDVPNVLYQNPANPFVAEFVGLINKIPAKKVSGKKWTTVGKEFEIRNEFGAESGLALIRPEAITVIPDVSGTYQIEAISFLGVVTRVQMQVEGAKVIADLISDQAESFKVGQRVSLSLSTKEAFVESR